MQLHSAKKFKDVATQPTNHKTKIVFEMEFSPFKKNKPLLRYKPRTFAVPEVLVSCSLKMPETLRNLNLL